MMPALVDTHVHLCDAAFNEDRQAVVHRAAKAGVTTLIAVGEDLQDARRNLELAAAYPGIKPAAGLYPTCLDRDAAAEMERFIRANRARLHAIGEVGLDFWAVKDPAGKALQIEIFKQFIQLAQELNLPLNVHSRSAGRQAVALLRELGARKVQLHAFDGKYTTARPAIEAGYYFSMPPSIVRSRQKQKLLKHLPLDCLLVESDSPVLGPDPGERNEPANLPIAVQAIAADRGLPVEVVTEHLHTNTIRLYGPL
jgi:TatD DNase family protein